MTTLHAGRPGTGLRPEYVHYGKLGEFVVGRLLSKFPTVYTLPILHLLDTVQRHSTEAKIGHRSREFFGVHRTAF
jgi:hypothetical protein